MFTSMYALEWVTGANIWLIGCLLCLLVTFAIAFAIKVNRVKSNVMHSILGIVIPAILCDIVWFILYFPNGEYRNMGLASASGLFLYPLCLAVGLIIVSSINKSREGHK